MSSVPGVLLKIGWISHWDDDDLVKVTLRFLWSTTICRDSIFNVLGTKSCPLGRFWWLERLNTCQSSLLVKAWVFPKKPATSTCSWPSWSISLYPIVNAMSFPYILFGCISFNQPNMVQLDQSCGEKTWRTRSSGWGYKMKVSVQTHWSPFPPSNKTAYRMLPVGFFNVFFFSGIILSLMIFMVSLHLGEEVYVHYHPGIHTQIMFQCPSFDHFPEMIQFYASLQAFSWMVAPVSVFTM